MNAQYYVFRLSGCELSWRSCKTLSRVLSSQSSTLEVLDLNNNELTDLAVSSRHLRVNCVHLRLSGKSSSTTCDNIHIQISTSEPVVPNLQNLKGLVCPENSILLDFL